jgi:exodeoxyribonuclease VII large subunit
VRALQTLQQALAAFGGRCQQAQRCAAKSRIHLSQSGQQCAPIRHRQLRRAALRLLATASERSQGLLQRLQRAHPGNRLRQQAQRLDELDARLRRAWEARFTRATQKLLLAQRGLHAISPLATLERGYAIVTGPDGAALQDAAQVKVGDAMEVRLRHGTLQATVNGKRP